MDVERSVARILRIGTLLSMAILAAGSVAMLASGVSPLAEGSTLAETDVPADLAAGRPDGILWLGLLVLVATPSGRVVSALFGYLRDRQTGMVLLSAAILAVIAASIGLAVAVES